ncbi:MAG TPA: urate hydroxylase PuuD [Vicinamibacteria bacterium]|nr:urate hydroxylase PuuD [Vicinamibacteria bacterium]
MEILNALFRWTHILAGIIWIGMLYFFNFVNGPFQGTLDAESKKKVNPELMGRTLWWFRWGAAWTWVTGVVLLLIVFYHGGIMFQPDKGWNAAAGVMVAVTFLAVFLYDALHKSPLGKDPKVFGTVSFVLATAAIWLMASWAGFSYRAFNIHLAALMGTAMAFNVWYRIWPAQQKILAAVKGGTAPEGALVALAGTRSRHNTYMSAPLFWGMVNSHTTTFAGGNLGITESTAFLVYPVFILISWHVIWQLYKRAPKVKGL